LPIAQEPAYRCKVETDRNYLADKRLRHGVLPPPCGGV
jgi:hypothetical protein